MKNQRRSTEYKSPGQAHRVTISVEQLFDMFPTEQSARNWFEAIYWPGGRCCGKCGGQNTKRVPNEKPMPYWCSDCKSYFSVRTGTSLQSSRLPLRKWVIAIYLYVTSLKSVSSMKLHRDLGVTQKTAWFMLQRLREAWLDTGADKFMGPVEVDETFIGGRRDNMPSAKRRQLKGRGTVGKTPVVGAVDRDTNTVKARVVERRDKATLHGFIGDVVHAGAEVYTDDFPAYRSLPNHQSVNHSAGQYAIGDVHTNAIESFWSMFKRSYTGTFHKLSKKHLQRYISEFAARRSLRQLDTAELMANVVSGLVGRRVLYRDLMAD